jgi:hypothetical protein
MDLCIGPAEHLVEITIPDEPARARDSAAIYQVKLPPKDERALEVIRSAMSTDRKLRDMVLSLAKYCEEEPPPTFRSHNPPPPAEPPSSAKRLAIKAGGMEKKTTPNSSPGDTASEVLKIVEAHYGKSRRKPRAPK